MKKVKLESIKIPFESYLYLRKKQHEERSTSGRALSEEYLRKQFYSLHPNGIFEATKDSFGGCNGSPVNGWEERRWTSWSVAQLKEMLTAANLPFEEGDEIECIYL